MLRLSSGRKISSFQIIICGFLAVILVGTMLLMLPLSTADGHWATLETALFTSVSAVCVTGLVVRDSASYWSTFGQIVILLLMFFGRVGGLTIMFAAVYREGAEVSHCPVAKIHVG